MRITYLSIILWICFVFTWSVARAQDTAQVKPILYKVTFLSGISMVGELLDKTAEGPYRIRIENGKILEFNESMIYRIKPVKSGRVEFVVPEYRWGLDVDALLITNGLRNIGSGLTGGVAFSAINYIQSRMGFGVGAGLYNYDESSRRIIIPLFAEVKWRLIQNPTTPVISMRGGYGIAGKNYITGLSEKRGGYFINPFFGYEFGTDRKVSWTIGAGMMIQKAYYAYRSGTTFADEDILFRRTEVRLTLSVH